MCHVELHGNCEEHFLGILLTKIQIQDVVESSETKWTDELDLKRVKIEDKINSNSICCSTEYSLY